MTCNSEPKTECPIGRPDWEQCSYCFGCFPELTRSPLNICEGCYDYLGRGDRHRLMIQRGDMLELARLDDYAAATRHILVDRAGCAGNPFLLFYPQLKEREAAWIHGT